MEHIILYQVLGIIFLFIIGFYTGYTLASYIFYLLELRKCKKEGFECEGEFTVKFFTVVSNIKKHSLPQDTQNTVGLKMWWQNIPEDTVAFLMNNNTIKNLDNLIETDSEGKRSFKKTPIYVNNSLQDNEVIRTGKGKEYDSNPVLVPKSTLEQI